MPVFYFGGKNTMKGQMKSRARVDNAIHGLPADRIPFGEIFVDPLFCQKVLGSAVFNFSLAREFWELLGLDLIVFHPGYRGESLRAAQDKIFKWREKTDYYVFAIIEGGFSKALALLGFSRFMHEVVKNPADLKKTIRKMALEELKTGAGCLEAGAQAVMIGDDIAYQKGTYLSPEQMRQISFPALQEQVERLQELSVPVFFHSDGNLNAVLDDLLALGFDGLQGLEPSAGMDLAAVKEKAGSRVCLMGNLDLSYLHPEAEDEEIVEAVETTFRAAPKTGHYIFGTSGGLHKDLPVEKVKTMYSIARQLA